MMAETLIMYQCTNGSCPVGSTSEPGHFTGGITADQVNLLTGSPVEGLKEGTDFGEGICPNCGKKGAEVGTHEYADHAGSEVSESDD